MTIRNLAPGRYPAIERDWAFVVKDSEVAILYRQNVAMGVVFAGSLKFTKRCHSPRNRMIARAMADIHLDVRSQNW